MAIKRYLAMTGEEIANFDQMTDGKAWMFCPFEDNPEQIPWQLPDSSVIVLTDARKPETKFQEYLILRLEDLNPKAVILDFQRKRDREGSAFVESLRRAVQCPVILPEGYAHEFEGPVFLPPVPLHSRLCEHIAPWKGREIWLDLSGEGEKITLTENGAAFEALPRFSPPEKGHREKKLHCHYTISQQEDAAMFTLWRTEEDVMDLLQDAEMLGIRNAIGLYQEWQGSSIAAFRGET